MKRIAMTERALLTAALLGVAQALPLGAQSATPRVTLAPYSDLLPRDLLWGAESPDGRFYFAGGDSITRYDRQARRWEAFPTMGWGRTPAWSPNGRFLAYAKTTEGMRGTHIWIQPMDSATGRPSGTARRVSDIPGDWPTWSPDSRRLVFTSAVAGTLRFVVIPFNGGEAETFFEAPGGGGHAEWSPDGQYLFGMFGSATQPANWVRINVATKRVERIDASASGGLLGYSPDGSRLAFYDFFTSELAVTSPSGQILQRYQVPNWVRFPAWSRSAPGEITGIQSITRGNLFTVSLPGGQLRALGPVESATITPVFSPDGRRLAYGRQVDGIDQLFIANADGSSPRAIGQSGDIEDLAWSPSGSHIAYMTAPAGELRVIDIASGSEHVLVRQEGAARARSRIRWRSDGQAIHYVWNPRGPQAPEREAREVTLNGGTRVLAAIPGSAGQVTFANDTLALVLTARGVDGVNLRTGAAKTLYSALTRGNGGFGFSRDGEWTVFTGKDSTRFFPVTLSLRTGQSRRIPHSLPGQSFALGFHPDGRNLVAEYCLTCDNGDEKWDVVLMPMNGDPARVLTSSLTNYRNFGFPTMSPDGSTLVFFGAESWNTRIVSLRLPGNGTR